jgi:hypothetical protein
MAICDPDDAFHIYGTNSQALLVDAHGTIVYKKVVTSFDGLVKKLADLL